MKLDDRLYDVLKWVCLIVMPASAVLYATLGQLWNLPYADVIPATINAVATFIGVCIGVSTLNYNKDTIGFADEQDGIGGDPEEEPAEEEAEELTTEYENLPEELTDEELKELEEGE